MLVELAELQTNISFCGSIMFVAVSTKESKFVVHIFLILFLEINSARHKYPRDGFLYATCSSINLCLAIAIG